MSKMSMTRNRESGCYKPGNSRTRLLCDAHSQALCI